MWSGTLLPRGGEIKCIGTPTHSGVGVHTNQYARSRLADTRVLFTSRYCISMIQSISTTRSAPQVFAWDTSKNAPDDDEDDGRSYISAVSEAITDSRENCNGRAKSNMGEARMDIEDSEMGYLGFHDGESYGLTWKVGAEEKYFLYIRTLFSWL